MVKKIVFMFAVCLGLLTGIYVGFRKLHMEKEKNMETKLEKNKWQELLEIYGKDETTDRLIFVKYQGGSNAWLEMHRKNTDNDGSIWEQILECDAFVGKEGAGKMKEGDMKTPIGTFWITSAFGIKDDPGAGLSYTKVDEYLYWSEEEETYNQMVDVRTLGREKIKGEHLIEEDPAYNYAMVIGYNTECVFGEGSAIFLHGKGKNPYTAGCVAVDEEHVKFILQNATEKMRICIYDI